MASFRKLYYFLYNQMTDALEAIEKQKYVQAADILKSAQITAEEIYMDGENEALPAKQQGPLHK